MLFQFPESVSVWARGKLKEEQHSRCFLSPRAPTVSECSSAFLTGARSRRRSFPRRPIRRCTLVMHCEARQGPGSTARCCSRKLGCDVVMAYHRRETVFMGHCVNRLMRCDKSLLSYLGATRPRSDSTASGLQDRRGKQRKFSFII